MKPAESNRKPVSYTHLDVYKRQEPDALISLVRSGKVEGVKLEYNQSDGGWAVSEYDDYFKKWFTTFFEGSMADNKQDIFEDILNTLPDQLLYALASEKNLILPLNLYDLSLIHISTVLFELWEAGYDCEWCVVNSKDFGVPQHRERVYLVGHLRDGCAGKVFPFCGRCV